MGEERIEINIFKKKRIKKRRKRDGNPRVSIYLRLSDSVA